VAAPALIEPTHISQRYRVVGELGDGGMGSILRVIDESTNRELALKRLRLIAGDQRRSANLVSAFQREYCTLAELVHPRVIAVHDYGVDDEGPYYTMDLLGGRDLNECVPLPWRDVCAILRDVCSALALLHSRFLLHRDVSPRNVRCTDDGRASLLDFGAMTPFGRSRQVVGTAPFVAPESLHGQELDARTDLFSLGVLGYYALTGALPYPAQRLDQLPQAWLSGPVPLDQYVDVPPPMAALITALLSTDMLARPTSAAEVASLLSSLANLPSDVQLHGAQLVTPALVGRETQLEKFKLQLHKVRDSHGEIIFVIGPQGIGRTRFVSAAQIEAKLVGVNALHASCSELTRERYGVLQALGEMLCTVCQELALETLDPYASSLSGLLPSWCERVMQQRPNTPRLAGDAGRAFVDWFDAVSARVPLGIFVDDFQFCDELSADALATLSTRAADRSLLVVLAVEQADATERPAVAAAASTIGLAALTESQTLEMLRSLFGSVAHLEIAASWIQHVARGNPRAIVELAQHLVSNNIAWRAEGGWVLPESLRELGLPQSLEQAGEARLADLKPAALYVAHALSLVKHVGALELAEIVELAHEHFEADSVYAALTELVGTGIVACDAETYTFRDASLRRILQMGRDPAAQAVMHGRLAEIYLRRQDNELVVIAADHLRRAGDLPRAYLLMRDAHGPSDISGRRALFAKSQEGVELHQAILQYAETHGASIVELHRFRKALLQLSATYDPRLVDSAPATLARLRVDTGLVFLDETSVALEPATRGQACLQRALKVWENSPVAERGLHPLEALKELGTIVASLCATYTRRWSGERLPELQAALEPFRWIPGIELVHAISQIVERACVLGVDLRQLRAATLQLLDAPIPGVDPLIHQSAQAVLNYYQGLDQSLLGMPVALEHAKYLETLPSYAALALHIRSLYLCMDGDGVEMEACRRRMEAFALREVDTDQQLRAGAAFALSPRLLAITDSLSLQRELVRVESDAADMPGWKPWAHLLRAHYQLQHAAPVQALRELDAGLQTIPPIGHTAWQFLVVSRVHVLIELGDFSSAFEQANAMQAEVRCRELQVRDPYEFEAAIALAEGHAGQVGAAIARVERALSDAQRERVGRFILGSLHEAAANLASLAGHAAAFASHAEAMSRLYRELNRAGLLRRYEQLLQRHRARHQGNAARLRDRSVSVADAQTLETIPDTE
jgi:hypothetical protein